MGPIRIRTERVNEEIAIQYTSYFHANCKSIVAMVFECYSRSCIVMYVHACITQYGSSVYRDCHGLSSIIAIHKEISVITFSFNLNLSFKDIKVENI